MQLSILIPEENLTKILLLDVVYVDAVIMDEAMELVNPFTSVSHLHTSGVTSPVPHV
jgi:hypothetical protein